MRLDRGLLVVAALAMSACVPSEADPNPQGGDAVTLAPSAATQGAPFTTPDGWTVTIHKFVIRVAADDESTYPGPGGAPIHGGGQGPTRVLSPGPGCVLQISAVAAGASDAVSVEIAPTFPDEPNYTLPPCGIDAATIARFETYADDYVPTATNDLTADVVVTPTMMLVAEATKANRHLAINFAISGGDGWGYSNQSATVIIKANVGVPVTFQVGAEAFFIPSDITGIPFDQIAASDLDGDGTITGQELAATPGVCPPNDASGQSSGDDDDGGSSDSADCPTFLRNILDANMAYLFGAGTTP